MVGHKLKENVNLGSSFLFHYFPSAMFSSTQNSKPQPQPDANATLAQAPALAPVLTVAVSDATSTSASSVTVTECYRHHPNHLENRVVP